jgi:TATA-box binding protein (TBP) (component of TFIID and TFIIIB)
MNEKEQELVDLIQQPQALRERLETLGISPQSGTTTVRYDAGEIPNLNALAIGLGLENIHYEPATFAGLIYYLNMPDVTVIFGFNGYLTSTSA